MAKGIKQDYSYAIDEYGTLIHIQNAHSETSYKCPSCGKLMIQRKGQKRRWHFAHKADAQCNYETYLHKIAKTRIRQTFLNSDKFLIIYNAKHICNAPCPLELEEKCDCDKEKQFDLRQWYDVCEEESEINGFVADLLFKSSQSPNRPPLLIEIAVTHKCTQEKIQSGLRIIEINIKSEDDIEYIIQNEIIEGKNSENYFSKEDNILFYNFSKSYSIEPSEEMHRYKYIFGIRKDGHFIYRQLTCSESYETIFKPEYNIIISPSPIHWPSAFYLFEKVGINNVNCGRCHFYRRNEFSFDTSAICILYKKRGTPRNPDFFFARNCSQYKPTKVDDFNEPIENIEKLIIKTYANDNGVWKFLLGKNENYLDLHLIE